MGCRLVGLVVCVAADTTFCAARHCMDIELDTVVSLTFVYVRRKVDGLTGTDVSERHFGDRDLPGKCDGLQVFGTVESPFLYLERGGNTDASRHGELFDVFARVESARLDFGTRRDHFRFA